MRNPYPTFLPLIFADQRRLENQANEYTRINTKSKSFSDSRFFAFIRGQAPRSVIISANLQRIASRGSGTGLGFQKELLRPDKITIRVIRAEYLRTQRLTTREFFPGTGRYLLLRRLSAQTSRGHFHRRQSHSWSPLGPEKYVCLCGQRYLTGAVEWTNLSEYDLKTGASRTL